MRDVLQQALTWQRDGIPFAVATTTATWRSAPRPVGAAMAVSSSGEVAGSLSGGCVEGAVHQLALDVLESGEPAVEQYGVTDDDAFAVGLTCGGVLDVLVRPFRAEEGPLLERLAAQQAAGLPAALVTVVEGAVPVGGTLLAWQDAEGGRHTLGALGTPEADRAGAHAAFGALAAGGAARTLDVEECGTRAGGRATLLVESYAPPPRMLVFGATDFAEALTRIGRFLGYHVVLCDARPVFATAQRFPYANEIVVDWPHRYLDSVRDTVDERTAVCLLTHDPKFDVPALTTALRSRAGYVGAMGSRRSHTDRLERLREAGLSEPELTRLRSPIGLDLAGHTPEETALSVAAELVASRSGGTGTPLSTTDVPLHRATGREVRQPEG
ncbi:XdhC family protein [Streptomyces sulphureus]|uniref:XdhC family protein n=1 Tax=Streptomyces sulphureus TaxID=47758 RepID=UPI0003712AF3|nr:XdhC/CoxI family protein [Streptomyces sulphureus]